MTVCFVGGGLVVANSDYDPKDPHKSETVLTCELGVD